VTAVVLFMIRCTSVVVVSPLDGMPPKAPIERIKMTAQRYNFSPEIVHVKVGTHVFIEIEGLDVKHGFKLDRYGIDIEIPAEGDGTVIVEFYTRKVQLFAILWYKASVDERKTYCRNVIPNLKTIPIWFYIVFLLSWKVATLNYSCQPPLEPNSLR